jgi:hypothetical protein
MWCLAICSYCTRFTCPLVESPLPGKSLQGSRKLSEHNSSHTILSLQHSQILKLSAKIESCEFCGFSPCLDACSIMVQQFGGKHGQSWKVAEKLKESDSYVILCV